MECNITIESGTALFYAWSDSCNELIESMFQLLPSQKETKTFETSDLQAFNASKFLEQNGVCVRMDIRDPAEHARLTTWSQKLLTLRTSIDDSDIEEFVTSLGINLRDLQKNGLKRILQSHFSLVAALCGAGKTLLNLCVAQFKKNKSGKILVFICAPSACVGEYSNELNRFRGYFDLTMADTSGMSVKEASSKILDSDCDIYLVSVDSIKQLQHTIQKKLQSFNGETLFIVEEGHCVKNVSSRRSKGVQGLAPLFDQVIIATATPLPLGAKDLRGYIALVGLPQPEEAYSAGIPSHDYALLEGIAFITDEDDIPFAPIDSGNIEFNDLNDLNSKIMDSVNAELDHGRKVVIFTSTNKALETAYDLFPDIPRSVLSGSFYTNNCKSNGLTYGRNKEMQKRAISEFNNDPECKILIANYKVGSTGLNLQYSGARMAIFYEITNSGADFFQSKYRIRRPNIFPSEGFKYLYAVPQNPKGRRLVMKQFMKEADQSRTLKDIKQRIGRSV